MMHGCHYCLLNSCTAKPRMHRRSNTCANVHILPVIMSRSQRLIFIPMSSLCRKVSSLERANLKSRSPSVTLRLITFTSRKYTVSETRARMASHPHCVMLIFISDIQISKSTSPATNSMSKYCKRDAFYISQA